MVRKEGAAFILEPEMLRMYGFFGFMMIVATGIFLTKMFSGLDLDNTLLTKVFGYNNICVYFDFPPSTYVLPIMWAPVMCIFLLYVLSCSLHYTEQKISGEISEGFFQVLRAMKIFEAITLVAFSAIFAISPEGWDHTIWIHTIPFWGLQLGMVSMAVSNAMHGVYSGYWKKIELPDSVVTFSKIYIGVFILVVCFKVPAASNAMLHQRFWVQTPTFKIVATVFDKLFLVCAVLVPLSKAIYLRTYKSHLLHEIVIKVGDGHMERLNRTKAGTLGLTITKEGKGAE